jgi:hypothetical protein
MFLKAISWSEYRYADERPVFGNDVVQEMKKTIGQHFYMLGMEGAFHCKF